MLPHCLTLAAFLSVAGCTSFPSSAQNIVMDKAGWTTYCLGRFLIDLPPQAQLKADYDIWGDSIKRVPETPDSLATKISQREHQLKALRHNVYGNVFIQRINYTSGAVTLLSWDSDLPNSKEYQWMDVYLVTKDKWRAFQYSSGLILSKQPSALGLAENLAQNLRPRETNEIPTGAGFCIDGAYITGSTFQNEGFNVGVTFPNHPGAFFSFSTDTGAEEDQLLDRAGGFLAGAAKMVAGLETLRKGQRNIGPIPAQEYLVAGSAEGQRAYSFAWESQGKDGSLSEPNITAGLGVLERDADSHGNPPPPAFRSDQEALELWDAIIDSIRLRPGAVGPSSAQNDTPNASQHGLRVTSGTPCPWPGVWTCEEAPQLGAQTIAHGVPMPSVEGNAVTWRLLRGL
ncbi:MULTISPECIES: T6SS immunity protein Tli4 family protein [Pseudomonas]|uniref:T6SS immunity protein Tli4 family protein n=1 Tax=Pseudomonas TaxID=286 RepID=UPI0012698C06|nr:MULTISPECIES: T6SS immunity protein Tli4 family protein [Pseudomonas]WBG62301.1 hypothetical protein ELR50_05170 [Pseudomonas citronellolis]